MIIAIPTAVIAAYELAAAALAIRYSRGAHRRPRSWRDIAYTAVLYGSGWPLALARKRDMQGICFED